MVLQNCAIKSMNDNHATGSVTGVYAQGCKFFRKRMECAITMAVTRVLD